MPTVARLAFAFCLVVAATVPASGKSRQLQIIDRSEQRCQDASPNTAVLTCYLALAARSQAAMKLAFEQSLRTAEAIDRQATAYARDHVSGSPFVEQLRASQASWLEYSASQCALEGASSFGGSGTDILQAKC